MIHNQYSGKGTTTDTASIVATVIGCIITLLVALVCSSKVWKRCCGSVPPKPDPAIVFQLRQQQQRMQQQQAIIAYQQQMMMAQVQQNIQMAHQNELMPYSGQLSQPAQQNQQQQQQHPEPGKPLLLMVGEKQPVTADNVHHI